MGITLFRKLATIFFGYYIVRTITHPKAFMDEINAPYLPNLESFLTGLENYDPYDYYDRMIAQWGNVERGIE